MQAGEERAKYLAADQTRAGREDREAYEWAFDRDQAANEVGENLQGGAAAASVLAKGLIDKEWNRVASLNIGQGTLVDRRLISLFDKASAEAARSPLQAMRYFEEGGERIEGGILAGGYGSYDGKISVEDQKRVLRLDRAPENLAAVNELVGSYALAFGSVEEGRTRWPTEVKGFLQSYGALSETDKGYALATIVNGSVKSAAYMDWYSAGGYQRDAGSGQLESSIAPWELVSPRSIARTGFSALRAVGTVVANAGRSILSSTLTGLNAARLELSAAGELLGSGVQRTFAALFGARVSGGAAYVNGKYVHGLVPRSNLEVYGSPIVRGTEDIPAIMQRVGVDTEGYRFAEMTEAQYQDRVARMGTEFDATYGPARLNTRATYTFAKDIASQTIDGKSWTTVMLRPGTLSSDEAIVQAVSHEFFEIEELRHVLRTPQTGAYLSGQVSASVKGNLHYEAVNFADETLSQFRSLIPASRRVR
jgi:hypothetical protein